MTNLISRERGKGKTHDLIITSAMTGYPIVCINEGRAIFTKQTAEVMGYKIPDPISAERLKQCKGMYKDVLVDDLEYWLSDALDAYFGTHVVSATISTKEDKYANRE